MNGVRLDHVIQAEQASADPARASSPKHERIILMAPLIGLAFDADCGKVWMALKDLTLKGPAWSYISNPERSQGRAKILALKHGLL